MRNRTRSLIVVSGLLTFMISSCARTQETPVTVFAASSLVPYFNMVEEDLEAVVGPVAVNFAGSHYLVTQILAGAPADAIITADIFQVDRLRERSVFSAQQPVELFSNELVLAVRGLRSVTAPAALREVAERRMRLVRADPEAPLGRYTDRFLADLVAGEQLTPRQLRTVDEAVVSLEENARLVATKLQIGAADAALLYATDARAITRMQRATTSPDPSREQPPRLPVLTVLPAHLSKPPTYYALVLNGSEPGRKTRTLIDWVQDSTASHAALAVLGFTSPRGNTQ